MSMILTAIRSYAANWVFVLRALLPLPLRGGQVHDSTGQILLALLTAWGARMGYELWFIDKVGGIEPYGIKELLAQTFLVLLPAGLAAFLVRQSGRIPALAVMALLTVALGFAIDLGVLVAVGEDRPAMLRALWVGLPAAATAIVLMRVFTRPRLRDLWRGAIVGAAVGGALAAGMVFLPQGWIFYVVRDDGGQTAEYIPVDVEKLYLSQPGLMADQIAALTPQHPGKTDLYAVLLGGTSHQGVFLREVDQVAALMAARFGTEGHMMRLANSHDDPFRLPMGNKANLAAALHAVAARMDRAEDIAFLYLTSHGGADVFSLSFYEAGTTDLTAPELAGMLDDSGLRNVVVVISACKSGSFVDDLAAPDRLIITAAAADRNSFGCSDKTAWTWWGSAYFDNALHLTRDFRAAFVVAKTTVSLWEFGQGHKASHPQMAVGADIGAVLDRWLVENPESPQAGAIVPAAGSNG